MPLSLLSEHIRKYVREKRWDELRPIQKAAIQHILTTENHYILASRTASGKTEAAFLPILSKVNFNEKGIQVLYISPLIALINDQFNRIEELCKNMEVPVTKWHGEANRTLKEKIIKNPEGIILITPESLEAMFVNKPYNVKNLFSDLKFVVIDEIHSFIGTERGTQLKSILSRLQEINNNSFRIVGLSATLGDFNEAKKFTGDEINTKVLIDKTPKEVNALFRYFKGKNHELPLDLLKDLYLETKDNKVLIFPNNRGLTEVIAVKLKKISDRVKGHSNYFSHHSSVDKEVREYVEFFAKNNKHQNFTIACTSTLELGIDIGTVDEVVQIDATHSIASLIQRVGRSGRREGEKSNLFLYSTNKWSLLQSLACWLLYKDQFIEPPHSTEKPYDILLHQALSITKGHSGIPIPDLIKKLKRNAAFKAIEESEIIEIINYLIEIDFLEKLQQEVIIGVEGEKIVNSRDFYSMFKAEESFKVVNAGNKIGDLPYSPQIIEGENILLAARIWKIAFVDFKAKKIEVIPANDGKAPRFFGGGGVIHHRIWEKMFEILYNKDKYDFLDDLANDEIEILRNDFSVFDVQDYKSQRPLLLSENKLLLYTFTGTKTNRTLGLLFEILGIKHELTESCSSFDIGISKEEFLLKWNLLIETASTIDEIITDYIKDSDSLSLSKWGEYLPQSFKVKLMKNNFFDIQHTIDFLSKTNMLVENL